MDSNSAEKWLELGIKIYWKIRGGLSIDPDDFHLGDPWDHQQEIITRFYSALQNEQIHSSKSGYLGTITANYLRDLISTHDKAPHVQLVNENDLSDVSLSSEELRTVSKEKLSSLEAKLRGTQKRIIRLVRTNSLDLSSQQDRKWICLLLNISGSNLNTSISRIRENAGLQTQAIQTMSSDEPAFPVDFQEVFQDMFSSTLNAELFGKVMRQRLADNDRGRPGHASDESRDKLIQDATSLPIDEILEAVPDFFLEEYCTLVFEKLERHSGLKEVFEHKDFNSPAKFAKQMKSYASDLDKAFPGGRAIGLLNSGAGCISLLYNQPDMQLLVTDEAKEVHGLLTNSEKHNMLETSSKLLEAAVMLLRDAEDQGVLLFALSTLAVLYEYQEDKRLIPVRNEIEGIVNRVDENVIHHDIHPSILESANFILASINPIE